MNRAGAAVLLAWLGACAHADVLSPAERRGRELFLRGATAAGRAVPVTLNDEPSPVAPACASCHGRDGRGRPEGGLEPADVRWQTLSRPLAATGTRPARPAYDPARLKRAVTMGIDAAGRRLDTLMPRYQLQREDADDLLAFLTRLGTLADPGLAPDAVRVGMLVVPGSEGDAALAQALAWADGLAARGGIYARRPEVVVLRGTDELHRLAEPDEPFVLVGVPDASSFEAVAAWAARHEVPWVLPRPSDGLPALDKWVVVLAPSPHGVPPGVAALALLERALERIGRNATRESLVAALEALREPRR